MSTPHPVDNARSRWNIDFQSVRPAELHSADSRDCPECFRGGPHRHVVVAASLPATPKVAAATEGGCRGALCVAINTATQRRGYNRGRVGIP